MTQIRQYRVGPFPIFDVLLAFLAVFLLAPLFTRLFAKMHLSISRAQWMWLTLPFGILVHLIIGQHTPLTLMFIDLHGYYTVKVAILLMVVMGLKDIRKTAPEK